MPDCPYPNHDFNRAILRETAHRPWPLPPRPWVMTQTWHDLLFAHWTVDPAQLRALVPACFPLDLHEGTAWVGVVPFYMTNVAPRFVPALPRLSHLPELNVRTYVTVAGKPGVFFFSLDAGLRLAVAAARGLFNRPYFTADMAVHPRAGAVEYTSRRRKADARFAAAYGPAGDVFNAAPGSLEYFLTERYGLYALSHRGRPFRLQIHHPPWPLQPAWLEARENTMLACAGITAGPQAPLLHFSRRQDMVGWWPEGI